MLCMEIDGVVIQEAEPEVEVRVVWFLLGAGMLLC